MSEFARQLDEVGEQLRQLGARISAATRGDPCRAFRLGCLSAQEHALAHTVADYAAVMREVSVLVQLCQGATRQIPMTKDFVRVLHERARAAYENGTLLLESLAQREWVERVGVEDTSPCPGSLN